MLLSTKSRNIIQVVLFLELMEGIELKTKREGLGLTQTELADILGVKMNTVYRWESGILAVPKSIELAIETVERNYSKLSKKKSKT
jgi:DNA-binding transcriptional regulator YiaG